MFARLLSSVYRALPSVGFAPVKQVSPILKQVRSISGTLKGIRWDPMPIHVEVRNNWVRPKETKRMKAHGFKKRMSTLSGRKILMRRILTGQSILSH